MDCGQRTPPRADVCGSSVGCGLSGAIPLVAPEKNRKMTVGTCRGYIYIIADRERIYISYT